MTKSELAALYAEKAGTSKKDAEQIVTNVLDLICETLATGEKVQLVGFGTFEVRERAARVGKNPRDGSPLDIPASKSPVFKPGKALKDAINK